MLWLRIWKRPFLTGQWLPGRCGGGDDRNVKVLWSYSGPQMNESMNWKHSVEWNDFNLELNVVLASTCTVQVDAPRATIITALGGWIFRDFGALWSKVPCSISDFNGNIIDVFIIWCFFFAFEVFSMLLCSESGSSHQAKGPWSNHERQYGIVRHSSSMWCSGTGGCGGCSLHPSAGEHRSAKDTLGISKQTSLTDVSYHKLLFPLSC